MTQPVSENPSEKNTYEQVEYVVKVRKRSLLRRIGCFGLILVWLVIMLIPFGIFILAIEGDITISHSGDVPDKHQHPRLQVQLITEIDFRGLGITTSSVNQIDGKNLCIETNVRYLLWQGEGEPATYCDCYSRELTASTWSFTETILAQCEP